MSIVDIVIVDKDSKEVVVCDGLTIPHNISESILSLGDVGVKIHKTIWKPDDLFESERVFIPFDGEYTIIKVSDILPSLIETYSDIVSNYDKLVGFEKSFGVVKVTSLMTFLNKYLTQCLFHKNCHVSVLGV